MRHPAVVLALAALASAAGWATISGIPAPQQPRRRRGKSKGGRGRTIDHGPHAKAWKKVFRGLACPPHVAGTHYVKEA